jgi:hypothetical protein
MSRRSLGTALVVLATMTGLAACTQGGEISRLPPYDSVQALADDSALIVVGTPERQWVATDIDGELEFTLSSFADDRVVAGPGDVTPGDQLVVRQTGASDTAGQGQDSPPLAPFLTIGSSYLLYLVATGLDGDLASQYYITGIDAGLYIATDPNDPGHFEKLQDSGWDHLPSTLSEQEALG